MSAPGSAAGAGAGLRIGLVAACRFPAPRGSQVLVDEMARAFARSGAETHLFAPLAAALRRPYRVHPLPGITGLAPAADPGALAPLGRLALDAGMALRLVRLVERERIDVLHAHNWEGLVAALWARRSTGVPVVFHAHGVLADELPLYSPRGAGTAARRLGGWCDARLPHQADHVVALCDRVRDHFVSLGVAPARISVCPPGLAQDGAPQAEGPRAPRAVFTGNVDRYQNLDLLLDAWHIVGRRLPAAELALVTHGDGTRLHRALGRRRLAGIRVVAGASVAEAAAASRSAAVGLSPRASWSGFPIKTLNYMAAGLPTVALAGSAKGVRDGETGWVVREPTAESLASALGEALADRAESARRGRAAREALAAEHSWGVLAPRLLELSRSLAGASAHRHEGLVPLFPRGVPGG